MDSGSSSDAGSTCSRNGLDAAAVTDSTLRLDAATACTQAATVCTQAACNRPCAQAATACTQAATVWTQAACNRVRPGSDHECAQARQLRGGSGVSGGRQGGGAFTSAYAELWLYCASKAVHAD